MTEEFSRTVAIGDLPAGGWAFAFDATADECAGLASRFDALAVDQVRAEGRLTPSADRREFHLVATVSARVRQRCVASLEPVDSSVRATCERIFRVGSEDPFDGDAVEDGEIHLAVDMDDRREPIAGDVIDIGAAVAEEIALNIDPYPRADGVAGPAPALTPDNETPSAQTPFAVLGRLLDTNRKGS